ncbi:MAG: DNA polymerase I [Candidatus Omnitrophica bacterium]|jgi:DNA polymerase-1|nr:DNA polymerase I [Candidatus Omnitrophota bacterium]
MSKETLYLIDGTSLCYRAFFAINLSTREGFPTGAIYGFYQTLKKIIAKFNPLYLGVCFDVSRKTFRQEKFKEYKIQRPPLPDALNAQFPLIRKLISSLGIAIVEKEGYEADDVIAYFCDKALKGNLKAIVISSDKDLLQLINDNKVSIYDYYKDQVINEEVFLKEYGFKPALIKDYLSLVGDSSDNIPGAKGIGKVGAGKLIKEFGSIEDIFSNLNKLSFKMQDLIKNNKEMIDLSKELITLQSPKLDLNWSDLKIKSPDYKEVYKMFSELEFKSLLADFSQPAGSLNIEIKEKDLRKELSGAKELIFSLSEDEILVFSQQDNCIYKDKASKLKDILEDKNIKKISCGFYKYLQNLREVNWQGLYFDVGIAAYLLDSSLADYELPTLVSYFLNEQASSDCDKFASYFIFKLYEQLSRKLKEENLEVLFYDIEMPLIKLLDKMQYYGLKIDLKALSKLFGNMEKEGKEIEENIFKAAGEEFNLNSPKQLAVVLFDKLKIKPFKRTKTGYSTSEEVLEILSETYPIAKAILEYRHLNKLKTTYVLPLIEAAKDNKGILHAQFNQTSTQTGRLSSSDPNLQSIPVKGKFSFSLREAFISSFEEGYLVSGDYSQIELRILAHLSEDEQLREAFKQNEDIHSFTATLLFGIKKQEVSDYQRDLAKRVNFGIIYGMSSYGLAKELKISPQEAQTFIDSYFLRYQGVKRYINKLCLQAEEEGAVKTILGRKRRLFNLKSTNVQLKDMAYRQAINTPVQGSCADLIKVAMVRIDKEFTKQNLRTRLIMQIHDELVFDVPKNELGVIKSLVKEQMEKAMDLIVPVKVKMKAGRNWAQMESFS